MEFIANLALGFETALSWNNLLYAFVGCVLGTAVGVLPGLGPLATISMLLPFTFGLEPVTALIMLAGIYYGSQYGGSTTAILVNLPGETSSVVTTIDGYQMAKKGRAGVALATAALSSFFAGTVGTLALAFFATPLTELVFALGPMEYFALMVLGLLGAVALDSGSMAKTVGMTVIGILIGLVGTDTNTGVVRFTFGLAELWDGVDIIVLAVGVFAFAEVMMTVEQWRQSSVKTETITSLWPSRKDFKEMAAPAARGSLIGAILGILPGTGVAIASYMAYSLEKRVSPQRAFFGRGAIGGVAAPEAANNAAAQTAFAPTLTLGIPGSATMALMLGAMMVHNIQPGPQVMTTNPALFWGLIASMWIGNLMLLVLNLPLVGIWARLLNVPYRFIYLAILFFCCIGVYSARSSILDVVLAAGFGLVGYVFRKLDCNPAPLMLGLVLGPLLEENFRRSMQIARGDLAFFLTRPIAMTLLGIAITLIVVMAFSGIRKRFEAAIEVD